MSIKIKIKKQSRGFWLIESVVGSAVVVIVTTAVLLTFSSGLKLATRNSQTVRADFLLAEGMEAARILRDNGWQKSLGAWPSGTTYRLAFAGNTWATTTNNIFIDGLYDRTIVVTNVYRDGNSDIAASGTLDPDTKKVGVSIARRSGSATTTITLEAYLTNLFKD